MSLTVLDKLSEDSLDGGGSGRSSQKVFFMRQSDRYALKEERSGDGPHDLLAPAVTILLYSQLSPPKPSDPISPNETFTHGARRYTNAKRGNRPRSFKLPVLIISEAFSRPFTLEYHKNVKLAI